MAQRRPSDLEAHLGYWLRLVSNAVSQAFARRVELEGVTVAEWVVLRVLFDAPAPGMAPSVLAAAMGMTRGAISRLADRLVEKELLARAPDPVDRRAQILALTPTGAALVPRLAALADENDAAFFGILEPAERASLAHLLRKLGQGNRLTGMPID